MIIRSVAAQLNVAARLVDGCLENASAARAKRMLTVGNTSSRNILQLLSPLSAQLSLIAQDSNNKCRTHLVQELYATMCCATCNPHSDIQVPANCTCAVAARDYRSYACRRIQMQHWHLLLQHAVTMMQH